MERRTAALEANDCVGEEFRMLSIQYPYTNSLRRPSQGYVDEADTEGQLEPYRSPSYLEAAPGYLAFLPSITL